MNKIEKLKELVLGARRIVFFGGAGVSVASGIPDFRGTGGLYSGDGGEYGERPETILSSRYLFTHPISFYNYYRRNMLYPWAEPNAAHKALAALEQDGRLSAVITQNIDGLHQRAGSQNVIELHGSTLHNHCIDCGEEYSLDDINDSLDVPLCPLCGGLIRPDVVLYGEPLNPELFYMAANEIAEADLLIVGGTSLTVNPAASLVADFTGEHLVIINNSSTPYDDEAELIIREPIEKVLAEII